MTKTVQNLQSRSGRFYARLAVPPALREIVGKRELTQALCADRTEAIRMLPGVIARFQATLDAARQRHVIENPKAVRPGRRMTIREMAKFHYENELRHDDAERFGAHFATDDAFERESRPAYERALRKLQSGVISDEERADEFERSLVGWALDAMRGSGHMNAAPGTPEYQEIVKALVAAQLEALQRRNERDQGNFNGKPAAPILNDPAPLPDDPIAARILSPDSMKPLNEILPLFLKGRNTSASMQNEHYVSIRMFEEFLGEPKPAYKITRQDVRSYMKALQETPANYTKRFPGKTLPEAIKLNAERKTPFDLLQPRTINNKWLSRLHAILAWCARNDVLPDNPALGVKLETKADSKPPRVPFDDADIAKIFAPFKRPFGEAQWAAILALFTGARPSELAQLRLESIREERGILILKIEEETKNAGSQRMIPVHSHLIALGFDSHLGALRKAGATHLFPVWYRQGVEAKAKAEVKAKETGIPITLNQHYPKFIPRRFNVTYRKSVGINDDRKDFYSFRHTFKTGLSQAGVAKDLRDYLCGHKDQSAGATYIHDVSLQTMKEAVEKLSFGGFNIK